MAEDVSLPLTDLLRPPLDLALRSWAAMVRADNEQVEDLPARPRPEDFYAPVAEQFRADPRRTDDRVLDFLRSLAQPGETWLDLGAGGGRYSLALALSSRRVYAVETSEGMRAVLTSAMAEHGVTNIDVFDERWPGPSACPTADLGLISHVGYDIADIGPFLDQFEAHVSRLCVAVLFERAPVQDFAPLWKPVHGEERALLPGLRELIALLFARGRVAEVTLFPSRRPVFESLEALHRAARRPTWVLEGTPEDQRLAQAVEAIAVRVEGGYALSPEPRTLGVVRWKPAA
jgi:SAM-dependent methyltransferase